MQRWVSQRARRALVAVTATVALAGCSGPAGASSTSPPASPSPSIPGSTAAPSAPPPTTLADCAAPVGAGALRLVHHFAVSPDDIAVDATGRLWITATEANLMFSMNADGTGVASQTVAGAPEGVAIDQGTIFVAQQSLNAIETIAPTRTTLVRFPNHTTNLGIDGIAVDAAGHRLLVPDSPTGELFAVPLTGPPTPRLLASNLGRPVDAAVDASGNVYVASESSPGLVALSPAGTRRAIGHFTDLDEVVVYGGLLYLAQLDRHNVVAVDPVSGNAVPIAVNLPAPQGLAVTAGGTLEIVDATTNSLYSLPACGVEP